MKKKYSCPAVISAETLEVSGTIKEVGLFPVVKALSAGYSAGKAVRKVMGGVAPSGKLPSFEFYKELGIII